jgi:hypothetical protein
MTTRSRRLLQKLAAGLTVLGLAGFASAESRPAARAETKLRAIKQSARTVQLELRKARIDGDARRVRCVSSKLSEVHAQLRFAEARARRDDTRSSASLHTAARLAQDLADSAKRCGETASSFQLIVIDGDGLRSTRARH